MFGIGKQAISEAASFGKEIITNAQEAKEHKREIVAESQQQAREFITLQASSAKDWFARNIGHILAASIVATFLFCIVSPIFGLQALEVVALTKISDAAWLVFGVYFGSTLKTISGDAGKSSAAERRHERKMEKLRGK